MLMVAQVREYPMCRIVVVHDGDTLRLDADLGFSVHAYVWVRLKDVRAPELSEGEPGQAAKAAVVNWQQSYAPDGGYVRLTTFQVETIEKEIHEQRTFIRYVGIVQPLNGADPGLNDFMRALGYTHQGI